jgi:hypothetical protein
MVAAAVQDVISRGVIHGVRVGWWWLPTVTEVLGLGLIALGVVLVARGWKHLRRPGRIAIAVIAVWTAVAATAVVLNDVRHWGDFGGGVFQGAFMVLYGLMGCAIVWAVDTGVRTVRRRPGLAP